MTKLLISVVIPVYNGEQTIGILFERIMAFCKSENMTFEVIFVWDSGPDNSWEVIEELKSTNPEHVVAIRLSRNFGQHNAIICGIEHAHGEFIITMDEDLQHQPEDIRFLLEEQKTSQSDVVYGIHDRKNHKPSRNLASLVLKNLIILGIPELHPDYSAFRLMKKNIALGCVGMQNSYTFIDGYLSWITNNFSSCQVSHQKRLAGTSSYNLKKLIKHSINIFVTFSDLPIKIVIYLSFAFFLFAIVYTSIVLYEKLILDSLIPGYASTVVLLSVGFGAILFSLGIIGQYIHKINLKTTKRPNYIISQKL